jgi:hypothetical protein
VDHDANTKVANLYFQQSLQYDKKKCSLQEYSENEEPEMCFLWQGGIRLGFFTRLVSILSECHATGYNNSQMIVTNLPCPKDITCNLPPPLWKLWEYLWARNLG